MTYPFFTKNIILGMTIPVLFGGCATASQDDSVESTGGDASSVYENVNQIGSEIAMIPEQKGITLVMFGSGYALSDCSNESLRICVRTENSSFVFSVPNGFPNGKVETWNYSDVTFNVEQTFRRPYGGIYDDFYIISANSPGKYTNGFVFGKRNGLVSIHLDLQTDTAYCDTCINGKANFLINRPGTGFGRGVKFE
jgi:hypothetical protein